ncbi:hypothetical protein [Prolixibacter sp. NT017]|uniref:hypothetical protein n=1 Tax=Prolixibacter sp. NT017 TaxID=2652390 RepID=UPI00127A3D4C|nr:hypothetical protein [Prolixibacter sp. NT017]GET24152.1 hypothetical protein NT017_04810 [Prolixibacter sp. NT017]
MDEYEGYFADCYALTDKRTESFIKEFLDHFVPERRETADEYEVPQYENNPVENFKTAHEAVKFLVENKSIKHSLYWANPIKSELRGAEIFFTDDGYVIMGIFCETKYPNTEIEDKIFKEIKEFCGNDEGYITYEDTPPHNSKEFREKIKLIEKARKHNTRS